MGAARKNQERPLAELNNRQLEVRLDSLARHLQAIEAKLDLVRPARTETVANREIVKQLQAKRLQVEKQVHAARRRLAARRGQSSSHSRRKPIS